MLALRMKSDGDFHLVHIHGCLMPGGFVGAEPGAAGPAQCASRATAVALAKVHPRKHGRPDRVATAFYGVRTSKRILHGRLSQGIPAALFSNPYHQRWRIAEAFKRLKHRSHLEAVSGLSQQALIIDVGAKVLADNVASLMCAAAAEHADLPARSRKCNRSPAQSPSCSACCPVWCCSSVTCARPSLRPSRCSPLPRSASSRGRSQPRPVRHVKPHPPCANKG